MDIVGKTIGYYSFNTITKVKIKKAMKEYSIVIPNSIYTKYKSMLAIYGLSFLNEVVNYYNNDLALTASICTSLPLNEKTEKKICFHLEHYFFRLIACWDYTFIALNEFLHTELISSKDIKQKIIEENFFVSIPVKKEGGYIEILRFPVSEEEKKEVEKKLKKELTVLTPVNLKVAINKKYEMTDHIRQIFELYNNEDAIQQAKTIRNSIVHSDSLTKKFSFEVSDLFKGQVISSKTISDTRNKIDLIFSSMEILKRAITLLKEMIILDLFPNRIENQLKEYYLHLIKCEKCNEENIIMADFVETLDHNPVCLHCNSENTKLIEKVKVSEPFYEQILMKFIEDTLEYYDQELEGIIVNE
ncbi:hypothetical protein [Paenibacillus sp. FSL P2-0136]|uniref:hypothetical protein n=1 Tax=Paenibacillus sp. FSL P2-0136 TaxID=2975317 RepID=UPI0030DBF0E7